MISLENTQIKLGPINFLPLFWGEKRQVDFTLKADIVETTFFCSHFAFKQRVSPFRIRQEITKNAIT